MVVRLLLHFVQFTSFNRSLAMKLDEPCGICGKPLLHGESFHTLWINKGDPSGKEPGKYNSACPKCAGFPSTATPVPAGLNPMKDRWCKVCEKVMPTGAQFRRLRIMKEDKSIEPGLHALCESCYEEYVPIVRKRLKKPKATGHQVM